MRALCRTPQNACSPALVTALLAKTDTFRRTTPLSLPAAPVQIAC
ncbi:hypothetical protein ATPR_2191 [Acetobacter tropicalis NBRC 101654]|uniref:Uncharacterized protein n=1 Tax=Acetobacter tropicalis NBRC 101654 TaxID=749388 RepID=F7VFP2_9PROT|nr:hypothetical protein ATPR_2191 [Acetobacter tropicalis NBRC 101654]